MIVGGLALLALAGTGAGVILVMQPGGTHSERAVAKAADCQASDLPWGQTLALLSDGSSPAGPHSPATDQVADWSRQLRRSDSGAFVECTVSIYGSTTAARSAYAEVTAEIERGDFLTTLLASPMHKLAAPGIADSSVAYEGQSSSGSNRHAIFVVFTKGTALGIVRFREGGTTLRAQDALAVARAMGGRLGETGEGAPPASGIETPSADVLQAVAPQDAVSATGVLSGEVADLNDAESAFIKALQSDAVTADELTPLQTTLASRALAVGRSADLLVDASDQADGSAATAAAAMYRNVATVAYTQALFVSDAAASDLLTPPGRAEAIQSVASLSAALSAGRPEHRAVFASALGAAFHDNVVAVPVPSGTGGALPDTVVTASDARITFAVSDIESLFTPEGTTAAALNAAADPAGGASIQDMRAVAAARLLLHADPKRAVTTAPLSAPAKPLTFEVANQIVMSKGVFGPDTDATLTFFALADRNDIMQMFSFFKKKAPDGVVESPNQMVWLGAIQAAAGGGGPIYGPLIFAITGGTKPSSFDDATADTLQRLIFDEYLKLKEPTISIAGARFVDPNVQIDVSYQVHQGSITVTCAVFGAQKTLYFNARQSGAQSTPDGYAGTETVNLEVDRTASDSWSYSCWSLYGQVGAGEVTDGGSPSATATPVSPRPAAATPSPRPTATSSPAPSPTPESPEPPPAAPPARPADCPTPDSDGITHTDLNGILRCS